MFTILQALILTLSILILTPKTFLLMMNMTHNFHVLQYLNNLSDMSFADYLNTKTFFSIVKIVISPFNMVLVHMIIALLKLVNVYGTYKRIELKSPGKFDILRNCTLLYNWKPPYLQNNLDQSHLQLS